VDAHALRTGVEPIAARYLQARGNVGLVIGVLAGGEQHVFGFGRIAADRQGEPNQDTLFEIGSVTKVFTAALLAEMSLRGEVALDDPVRMYLPESVPVPRLGRREVTLLHLATHSSGLPRLPGNLDETTKDPKNPYANYTIEDLYRYLSSCRLRRPPGRRCEYSNLGVGLLGHVLARRAGRSYEELVADRIAGPLGLVDTVIELSPSQQARYAPGHTSEGQPTSNWDLPTLAGAGALRASARDLLTFLAANLGALASALKPALELCHVPRMRLGSLASAWRDFRLTLILLTLAAVAGWLVARPPASSSWPISFFAAAIYLSALRGGTLAGLLAVGLTVLVEQWLWVAPAYQLGIKDWDLVGRRLVGGLILCLFLAGVEWSAGQIGLGWHCRWLRYRRPRRTMLWHNGGTGGYCSFIAFAMETSTAVVVLSNSANSVDDVGLAVLRELQRAVEQGNAVAGDGS
jgi:CubicO group peptidase (beta-lactamase class C family)